MQAKTLTRHPTGKQGVNINKAKYDVMRAALLETLNEKGALTFSELVAVLHEKLNATFEGSISWYATTVKLDLQARKQIKADKSKPPKWSVRKSRAAA